MSGRKEGRKEEQDDAKLVQNLLVRSAVTFGAVNELGGGGRKIALLVRVSRALILDFNFYHSH